MKEYRLSTLRDRVTGVSYAIGAAICFGLLLYSLRSNTSLLIICGLAVLLIMILLVLYAVNALKAVCIVDLETKMLQVKGVSNYSVDISGAVLLQTQPRKIGQSITRVLVFSDEETNVIVSIPTMFAVRQGMMAEPLAERMAKELGIAFKRNIPEWEFDKKLYQEHQKQVAQEEKEAAKKRRQERMQLRIQKRKDRMKK